MTKEQLEAIKRRADSATRGRWNYDGSFVRSCFGDEMEHFICRIGDDLPYSRDDNENAEFIAHARTDVPALVAEVERLMKILADDSGVMKSSDPDHVWEFKLCPECTKRMRYAVAVGDNSKALGEE